MFGREPLIGDTIVYNPPHYKGIVSAVVKGFSNSGLPIVDELNRYSVTNYKENTPKTGFAIVIL